MKNLTKIGSVVFLIVLCFAMSSIAIAKDSTKSKDKTKQAELAKVAVKPLNGAGVSKETSATLSEVLCSQIATHKKYQVLCPGDVVAILAATQQTALLGNCDNNSCYDALGKALNAPFLVVGTIGKVGKIYTINLSLISADDKVVMKRVSEEVKGDESKLLQAIKSAADKLVK